MPAIRCDALVLGSTLGSLVAACYLARVGLRVAVIEEAVHAKRPGILREPFLLTGLERGEPLDTVLRELTVHLIERRELEVDPLALQVLLPGGVRIDVGGGRETLAAEIEAYGVAPASEALPWLEAADALADTRRRRGLHEIGEPPRGLAGRLRRERGTPLPKLDPPPAAIQPLVRALLTALSPLSDPHAPEDAALPLRGARDGAARGPHAGRGLLDLLRRRLHSLHGEIRSVEAFALGLDRHEVSVEVGRDRLFAPALLLGAPSALVAEVAADSGDPPRWLAGGAPAARRERHLLRAEADALPIGMGARVACAAGSAEGGPWSLARTPDPADPRIEWVVLSGSGAPRLAEPPPLEAIAPFSSGRVAGIDAGPAPRWDLDAPEIRIGARRGPRLLRRRPWIERIGAEALPEAGFEGELLLSRLAGLRLAKTLGR